MHNLFGQMAKNEEESFFIGISPWKIESSQTNDMTAHQDQQNEACITNFVTNLGWKKTICIENAQTQNFSLLRRAKKITTSRTKTSKCADVLSSKNGKKYKRKKKHQIPIKNNHQGKKSQENQLQNLTKSIQESWNRNKRPRVDILENNFVKCKAKLDKTPNGKELQERKKISKLSSIQNQSLQEEDNKFQIFESLQIRETKPRTARSSQKVMSVGDHKQKSIKGLKVITNFDTFKKVKFSEKYNFENGSVKMVELSNQMTRGDNAGKMSLTMNRIPNSGKIPLGMSKINICVPPKIKCKSKI